MSNPLLTALYTTSYHIFCQYKPLSLAHMLFLKRFCFCAPLWGKQADRPVNSLSSIKDIYGNLSNSVSLFQFSETPAFEKLKRPDIYSSSSEGGCGVTCLSKGRETCIQKEF